MKIDDYEQLKKEIEIINNFLNPNFSNDMRWSDEIIIAINNREDRLKSDNAELNNLLEKLISEHCIQNSGAFKNVKSMLEKHKKKANI